MEVIAIATLQVCIDDTLMRCADDLFASLGLDTSTAIRIFLNAAVERDGIPFSVGHQEAEDSLVQAIRDTRRRENLYGPFDTAEEAIASMLED